MIGQLVRLVGRDEHDDLTALRLAERWQMRVGEGYVRTIHRLVHEQPVANEQRWDHRTRRDAIGRDEKGVDDEVDQYRAGERLDVLPQGVEERAASGFVSASICDDVCGHGRLEGGKRTVVRVKSP